MCFGCNKPGHKKSECPERKEGNTANVGAAWGSPVAMATQEIHYVSMAQVVDPSRLKETPAHDAVSSAYHYISLDD